MATNHVFRNSGRGPLSAELRGTDGHELAIVDNRTVVVLVAGRVPLSKHDQNHDPTQWVSLLSQAIADGDERRSSSGAAVARQTPVSARLPWFHVMTVCGLVVLLLPAGQRRMEKEQVDAEPTAAAAPSVLGWRQERSVGGLSFGDEAALTYRGLQAPMRSEANIATELSKIGRSALVPLRIALSQHLVSMSGIQRVVLRNLPASAHVSAGLRAADGTWVIEDVGFRDVVIAIIAPLDESLAIRIEGRSRERLVWVHTITGPGGTYSTTDQQAPLASGLVSKGPQTPPRVEAARVAPPVSALTPLPEVPVTTSDSDFAGRTSAIPAAALQPTGAVQPESRPKALRDRSVVRPPQKPTAGAANTSSWRDGVFYKDRN